MLITSPVFVGPLSESPSTLEFVQSLLLVGDEKATVDGLGVDEIALGKILPQRFDEPDVKLVDTNPCAISFTSGTTGLSKGVVMSHRYAIRVAEGVVDALDITGNGRIYTPWPPYHYGSAYDVVLAPILAGAGVALRKRFSLGKYWSDVRAAKYNDCLHLRARLDFALEQCAERG